MPKINYKYKPPFGVGDIVRRKANVDSAAQNCPLVLTVTRIMRIPDLDEEDKYEEEAFKIPYWFWGASHEGVEYDDGDHEYPGAIWLGYYELDPFLGPAKRAIRDA